MVATTAFGEAERAAWLEALPYALLVHDGATDRLHANGVGRTLLRALAADGGASLAVANPLPVLGLQAAAAGSGEMYRRRVTTPFGRLRATALAHADALVLLVERLLLAAGAGASVPSPWPAPLDPQAARLVRLVADGATNAGIAAALGVPEGTVKSRLHALCRRVGARGRVDLALLHRDHALTLSSAESRARRRGAARDWLHLAPSHHAASLALLDRVAFGLAALRVSGGMLWANLACTDLCGGAQRAAAILRTLVRRAEPARRPTGARPASAASGRRGNLTLWRAGPRLLGLTVRGCASLELAAVTPLRRAGLTGRGAEVAALLVAGHSNATIARLLEISRGTIDSYVSALYREFGVTTRVGLVNRVLDLTA